MRKGECEPVECLGQPAGGSKEFPGAGFRGQSIFRLQANTPDFYLIKRKGKENQNRCSNG